MASKDEPAGGSSGPPDKKEEEGAVEPSPLPDATPVTAEYMELYKLAVEMADRMSARRGNANAFFVTVNTALLAFLGLAELTVAWPVVAGGVVISLTWALLIKSYRNLNTAKFETINAAEARLPIKVFSDEWRIVKREPPESWLPKGVRKLLTRYVEFTIVEMIVPFVFAAIYLAVLFS